PSGCGVPEKFRMNLRKPLAADVSSLRGMILAQTAGPGITRPGTIVAAKNAAVDPQSRTRSSINAQLDSTAPFSADSRLALSTTASVRATATVAPASSRKDRKSVV